MNIVGLRRTSIEKQYRDSSEKDEKYTNHRGMIGLKNNNSSVFNGSCKIMCMNLASGEVLETLRGRYHVTNLPPMRAFLPPETVAMIEKYGSDLPPNLAFEEHMTILFSDMRGFTEMAEMHEAQQVYDTINASLAIQTRIVTEFGGSINKFLGDGLLACFSGENRGEESMLCLMELMRELPKNEGLDGRLPCRVGFGMHDGRVLLGLLGDENRKELTVLGDVPNTAARLCGIAQPFQGLMTEACMKVIPDHLVDKHCRYLNDVHFKGKREGMNVFYIDGVN